MEILYYLYNIKNNTYIGTTQNFATALSDIQLNCQDIIISYDPSLYYYSDGIAVIFQCDNQEYLNTILGFTSKAYKEARYGVYISLVIIGCLLIFIPYIVFKYVLKHNDDE